jgi:hypothetical protein
MTDAERLILEFKEYSANFINIIDKDGNKVLFKMNNIQRQINNKIEELEAQGKPVRIIILKPRQPGVSTFTQAKFLHKTATSFNKTALVVAHTDKSTNAIFGKTKLMYDNLPQIVKPMRKASNAQELIFDKPSTDKSNKIGLNSKFKISTAGGSGIGRSDTHHYVHLSELAFYEGDAKQIFIGIMQSIPKTKDTYCIIESTANGFNFFHETWEKACNNESEFVPMFFAWFDHEEYQMPVTEEERKQIMSNMNAYEKNMVELYNLPAERIKWYRWTLANDCQGDTDLMKQENPSNPEEAFLHTGRPVFDNDILNKRLEELKLQYKEKLYDTGYIDVIDGRFKFIPDKCGIVKIFKHPEYGTPYILADDPAEGISDGDYSAASMMHNVTGEQVAAIKTRMMPDLFAYELFKLATYYNKALIITEFNNHGGTVISALQNKFNYYSQYKREDFDEISKTKQQKFGFKTTTVTRPVLIDRCRAIVREHPELLNDIDTIKDMLTFVYSASGKEEAEQGCHDDTVIAYALQHEARTQQRAYAKEQPKPIDDQKYVHPSILIDSTNNPQLKRYYRKIYGRK